MHSIPHLVVHYMGSYIGIPYSDLVETFFYPISLLIFVVETSTRV